MFYGKSQPMTQDLIQELRYKEFSEVVGQVQIEAFERAIRDSYEVIKPEDFFSICF